jgi:hypothetical protein
MNVEGGLLYLMGLLPSVAVGRTYTGWAEVLEREFTRLMGLNFREGGRP